MASLCPPRTRWESSGAPISQSFMTWSPVAPATTCFAVGWKRTCPTLRFEAPMRSTGSKSRGTHFSAPQPSNVSASTFHRRIWPSSPAEATRASSCGDQSVSNTGAVCPRARGMTSGSFEGRPWGSKGDGSGKMAKAPPPDAFQLRLR